MQFDRPAIWIVIALILPLHSLQAQDSPKHLHATAWYPDTEAAVASRLCFAGRFQIKSVKTEQNESYLTGQFVEAVPGSGGNPSSDVILFKDTYVYNGSKLDLKVGSSYWVILTQGLKVALTIVAWGDDTPQTLAELKAVIQSPRAFHNDETWVRRRALWKGLKSKLPEGTYVRIYCENDRADRILYFLGTEKASASFRPDIYIYDSTSDNIAIANPQLVVGIPNRITFENGIFTLWRDGEYVISIG